MTVPSAALLQLAEVATGDLTGNEAEDALLEALGTAQQLKLASGWSALDGEEVSAISLTRAIGDILKLPESSLRAYAASIYAVLLSLHDAPVGTLCDPYAFSGFLQCLRGLCLPRLDANQQGGHGGTQQQQPAGAEQQVSPLLLLECVGSYLKHHSLRGSREMFNLLLDILVDLTESSVSSGGARPDKGNKRGGAGGGNRNQGASIAETAFAVLPLAMDGRHGDLLQVAAIVFSKLVPAMLGSDATTKRGGASVDRRGQALSLLTNFLSCHPVARPCLLGVMRQLCVRVPDKADSRQQAVASVLALVPKCDAREIRDFSLFLYRLSQTTKVNNRMVAVEQAAALLSALPGPFTKSGVYQRLMDGSCGAGDELETPWSVLCLGILVCRSNDKSASVRSKAIGCLADCAQAMAKQIAESGAGGRGAGDVTAFLPALCACRSITVTIKPPRGTKAPAAARGGEGRDAKEADDAEEEEEGEEQAAGDEPAGLDPADPKATEPQISGRMPGKISIDLTWMTQMCHARCRDEKAAVRKAALQLLDSVLQLAAASHAGTAPDGGPGAAAAAGPSAQDVQILEEATADSLVSVRKTALQVICNLVDSHPDHPGLANIWARCVLPMVRDPESAVQDAVLDRLTALLLDPVAALGSKRGGRGASPAESEIRQRLVALAQMGRVASSCLGKALTVLTAKKVLRGSQLAAGLETFLSAVILEPAAAPPPRHQQRNGRGAPDPSEAQRVQRRQVRDQREGAWLLLVEVAGQDPAAPSWQFLQTCWAELQAAGAGASAQEGAMLLWVISHAASRFPAADAANLAGGLLQAVLGFNLPCAAVAAHLAALHKLTLNEGGQAVVGPPAQWCGRVMEAAEEVLGHAMEARGNLSRGLATRCQLALFTLGEVVLLREARAPGGAVVKVQALLNMRPAGGKAAAGLGPAGRPDKSDSADASALSAVSAQAWTGLGKICMADEGLAKKCVALIVQEMSSCPNPIVRVNLLVALSDMVVQFTGLADAYVSRLAAMVRDPHELVRKQALALLANLLLRDYVKWRGALVHRFLLALVDESAVVRQLAQYLLSDSLVSKAPMLAYNHFIESLFVLNDCSAGLHANRSGVASDLAAELSAHNGADGCGFHLKGTTPIMRAKRDIIYTALLRRMKPEHRFAASAKLVAEVLGGVVDGLLPLAQAEEVLGDALRLLACKDMKVNANRFGAGAEDDGAEPTGTQEDVTKARGKLVGAMIRKHLIDSVVPLMVELRYMLQAQKHPLLGSLMLCLASLLRDHKSEIEDILVADKQLAREIMHDLKHYETMAKQQQQQQEAAMAAALAGNPDRRTSATANDARGTGPTVSNAPSATPAPGQASRAVAGSMAAGAPHPGPSQAGMMPPLPLPGGRPRKSLAAPPGVQPDRTPVAAEILANDQKRWASRPSLGPQQMPFGVAAGAKTPAAATIAVGGAGSLFTPRTGLLGTAQRGLGAAMGVMPSPAPLSTRAKKQQQQHRANATAGMLASMMSPAPGVAAARVRPGAGGAAGPSAAAAVAAAEGPILVALRIPDPIRPQPPRGAGAAAGRPADVVMTDQQQQQQENQAELHYTHRTPQAVLAAAVRAARHVVAQAMDEADRMDDGADGVQDRIAAAAGAAALTWGSDGAGAGTDAGPGQQAAAVKLKQEVVDAAGGPGRQALAVKNEVIAGEGGGVGAAARIKRRRGGA